MRKPWSVNWVRRGDFVDMIVLTMTVSLWIIWVLVAAAVNLVAGIFLLARWLVRRHRAKRQAKPQTTVTPAPAGVAPTPRHAGTVVRFLDQEAEIIYRPERVTEAMWTQVKRGVSEMDEDLAAGYVSRLVVEWDVIKRGRPYPIEKDAIGELPGVFVKAVFAQIMIDAGQRQASALRRASGRVG